MRVVVVGASGNVGTAVLRRLAGHSDVSEIVAVARRPPPPSAGAPYDNAQWHSIDVGCSEAVDALAACFRGAAAVIHLAWQIQPSHDRQLLRRTNVHGTEQVAVAALRSNVPALIVASSVGAYAPGPKDRFVDEDWPVTGVARSTYSRDKADVEALLDEVQRRAETLRLVRMRPALIFQSDAASQIARYFAGPLAPTRLLSYGRLPLVPYADRLRAQAVHADDAAEAYVRAALSDVRGPFNIAAEPILDGAVVADRFHGRTVPVPIGLMRTAAAVTWHARLQPTEPGWVDLAAAAPLLSSQRATAQLGWQPTVDAREALAHLFDGMGRAAGTGSPAMRPRPSMTRRIGQLLTGQLPGHGNPY